MGLYFLLLFFTFRLISCIPTKIVNIIMSIIPTDLVNIRFLVFFSLYPNPLHYAMYYLTIVDLNKS